MTTEASQVEEHVKTIQKHESDITNLHSKILELKQALSEQITAETAELRNQILEFNKTFDDQKDYITRFETDIKNYKKFRVSSKTQMEELHEKALKKVENLRIEFVKVSHNFTAANDKFSTIFNQTMDIE